MFDVTSASVANLIAEHKTALAIDRAPQAGGPRAGSRPMNLLADVQTLLPEIGIAVGTMALLIGGVVAGDRASGIVSMLAIALLAAAGVDIFLHPGVATAFGGAFVVDGFARFSKLLILAGSALCILMADEFFAIEGTRRFELPILMLLATLGMLLMVSASSFIALYMGLELQSLALYVLAAFNRDSLRSTEAGLKYFVLGALSSGMLLYGISLIYGFTGSTEFARIAVATASGRRRQYRPDLRPRLPHRRPRLQGRRRAVPHVDAGRLRGFAHAGHRLLRHRRQGGRLRAVHPRRDRPRSLP